MKIRISTKLSLLACCFILSTSAVLAAPAARAQMRNIRGAVKIFVANQNNWVVAVPRTHVDLQAGDCVRTGQDGSADILIDGATLKITSRSEIVIPQAPAMNAGKQRAPIVKVIIGKIYVWIIGARYLELCTEGAGEYARGTASGLMWLLMGLSPSV